MASDRRTGGLQESLLSSSLRASQDGTGLEAAGQTPELSSSPNVPFQHRAHHHHTATPLIGSPFPYMLRRCAPAG